MILVSSSKRLTQINQALAASGLGLLSLLWSSQHPQEDSPVVIPGVQIKKLDHSHSKESLVAGKAKK